VTAGLSAFLGHLFPVYLRFRGGKGVATGAGVVCVLVPLPAVGALFSWLVVVSASRMVSLASLIAALALCLLRLLLTPSPFSSEHSVLTFFCLAATVLVCLRHISNIRRLIAGTENRLKDSPTMNALPRILHVLAVGLWFGMAVFFTFVVGFSLFGGFETLALMEKEGDPVSRRPYWFPSADIYDQKIDSPTFPDPLRKEQGTRAAGFAVAPLLDWYYLLQLGCGAVALITAVAFANAGTKLHKVRAGILCFALVGAAGGYALEKKVSQLSLERNTATDLFLVHHEQFHHPDAESSSIPVTEKQLEGLKTIAEESRATFGMWHGISMMANLLTLLLVTVAMALTAKLPSHQPGETLTVPPSSN